MHRFHVLALAMALSGCACAKVPSGHAGIVFESLGQGTSRTLLGEGTKFIAPWNDVILYDMRVQDVKEQLSVLSKNGLDLKVDVSVRVRPRAEELYELQTQVGPQYVDVIVRPVVRSEARKVFGRYVPEEIYSTERESIERQIFASVSEALQGKHIVIEAVSVRDIDLPESIRTAIADKLAEEQRSQKMTFTLQREKQEAERKQIEAEGIARYQNVVRQGLTAEYLTYKGIEATLELAKSGNSKIIVVGSSKSGLPLVFQGDK